MLYITPPGPIYFITGSLCLWLPSPILPTAHPCLWQSPILFSVYVSFGGLFLLLYFRFHIKVRSYNICLSLSDLFRLAVCPQKSPMLSQIAIIPFFVAEWYSIVYVYITFSLSIDGRLGCLHVMAIVRNVAVNMGVQIPFRVSVFVCFGSRSVGSYSSSIFNFWGASMVLPIVAVPIYIPTVPKGSLCPTFLPTLVISCLFEKIIAIVISMR